MPNYVIEPPQSREEKILHKILGNDVVLEPPQSRVEALLYAIYETGGGGGGGAVQSVNGKKGIVVLTVSDLENDAEYINSNDLANILSDYVKAERKINGKQLISDIILKISDLENDKNYQNKDEVLELIREAIESVEHIKIELVDILPAKGENGIIYLVPNGTSGSNIKDEYIWIESQNKYEPIGNTEIDLSNYYTKSETYSQTEVDTKLDDYYKKTETYSQTEVDTKLDYYYKKTETYSQTEVDTELDKKIDDPATKADGQALIYDETEGKWVAGDVESVPAGGSKGQVLGKKSATDGDVEWVDRAVEMELTQAEYDALTEEEKTNGTIYFITDAEDGAIEMELTQAEYDDLTEEEKMNGTTYFIKDAEGGGGKILKNGIEYTGGGTIQASQLPVASADELEKVYQYIGATNTIYTNGYFYKCEEVTPATDPKTYKWTNIQVQEGGGGNANFELDTTYDFATIQNQGQGIAFDLSDDNGVTLTASDPGVYQNTKILATQDYVDNNMPVIVGSDWGVAKEGFARIPNSSSGGATVDVDISDLNIASDDDYEVLFVGMSDSVYTLSRMTVTSFTVKRVEASPNVSTVVRYVVFAKGYGSTPSGGTTGQVLTKKSNTDGDVEWADGGGSGAFVLDTSNPCSYNELQSAINTPKVILIKHEGNIYPFVEKWESDEGTKRYVNIASLQRQGADKGAMYFFFEATIGDFDSPMAYSSNYVQPTGKPYTDSVTGNLTNLTTTDKTNLVGAVNEVNSKTGMNLAVGEEKWYGTYKDENGVTYQVYSKTVYIPALPSTAGITQYNHGVANIKQILSIYGFTTDGFVLNAPRQVASDNISIYQASKSASNQTFSIEVGKDRSSKKAYVTMIYAKNNN